MNQKSDNTLAIIGLGIGVVGLLLSAIPCIGIIGIFPAALGLLIGGLAYFKAKDSGDPLTISVIAMVISSLAICLAIFWFYTIKTSTHKIDFSPEIKEYQSCDSLILDLEGYTKTLSELESELEKSENFGAFKQLTRVTGLAIQVEALRSQGVKMGCLDEPKREDDLKKLDSILNEVKNKSDTN